jgi:hypothetical protein
MRLSTRIHGALDYVIGLALLASPWWLGLPLESPGEYASAAVGAGLIVNALATDFELGLLRLLQIPVHLWIDAVLAVLLALSPWLFGFDREAWIPHAVLGIAIVLVAFFSHTVPGYERRRSVGSETG